MARPGVLVPAILVAFSAARCRRLGARPAIGLLVAAAVVVCDAGIGYAAFNLSATGGPQTISTASLTAPTGLSASRSCSSATSLGASLSWTASTSSATAGYSVLSSTSSSGPFSTVGTVSGMSTTTYTDTVAPPSAADSIYVAVGASAGMDVISIATNTKTATSSGLKNPNAIAVTPDGSYAWVNATGPGNNTVTPINLSTDAAGTAVTLSAAPGAMAITPDGTKLLVIVGNTVVPVSISGSSGTVGSAIPIGFAAKDIAVSPGGTAAWLAGANSAVSVNLATMTAGTAITEGSGGPGGTNFTGITITPDSTKAYLADSGTGKLWPLTLSSGTFGTGISMGFNPQAVVISPGGTTAWVAGQTDVAPITLSSATVGSLIVTSGATFQDIDMSPNGCWVYATGKGGPGQQFLIPISTTTKTAGSNISVDTNPAAIATAYRPVTHCYEVEGTRNLWTSPASGQATTAFGQPR